MCFSYVYECKCEQTYTHTRVRTQTLLEEDESYTEERSQELQKERSTDFGKKRCPKKRAKASLPMTWGKQKLRRVMKCESVMWRKSSWCEHYLLELGLHSVWRCRHFIETSSFEWSIYILGSLSSFQWSIYIFSLQEINLVYCIDGIAILDNNDNLLQVMSPIIDKNSVQP